MAEDAVYVELKSKEMNKIDKNIIQVEWGDLWDKVKDYVDEMGMVTISQIDDIGIFHKIQKRCIKQFYLPKGTCFRPRSLCDFEK